MRVLVASSNPHKLEEIAAVFEQQRQQASQSLDKLAALTGAGEHEHLPELELVTLGSLGLTIEEPEEDQPTFEGNAILKARYYARATGLPTIADDSGLEVDALQNQPGVRSARYAGVTQGGRAVIDPANNQLLLANLKGTPVDARQARFVCAMALALPEASQENDGDVVVVRGEVHGRIISGDESPRGQHGFGYDPLFFLPDLGKTMAELQPEQKNALSHRGSAARLLWQKLPGFIGEGE